MPHAIDPGRWVPGSAWVMLPLLAMMSIVLFVTDMPPCASLLGVLDGLCSVSRRFTMRGRATACQPGTRVGSASLELIDLEQRGRR